MGLRHAIYALSLLGLVSCGGSSSGGGGYGGGGGSQNQQPSPPPPQNEQPSPSVTYTCRHATEVMGSNFVYRLTQATAGKVQILLFAPATKTVTITETTNTGLLVRRSTFKFVPPPPFSLGIVGKLEFQRGNATEDLSFPVIPFGTLEGDSTRKEFKIGTTNDGETYLCPTGIQAILK